MSPPSSYQHPGLHINGKGITMKIKVFRYTTGIAATLSLIHDDCLRPKTGLPVRRIGKQNSKKVPAPPCLAEALSRESIEKIKFSWFEGESDEFMPVSFRACYDPVDHR
jgi:hypothetical protein